MPEIAGVLSSRRILPSTNSFTGEEDSKKQRHITFWDKLVVNGGGGIKLGFIGKCIAVILFVLLLVFIFARSRGMIDCGSYPRLSRLYGSDTGDEGVGFEFGSLGVPWCMISSSSFLSFFFVC